MTTQLARVRLNLWCVRISGRILFALFAIGWIGLARFVPAPSPLDSAEVIARRYEENVWGMFLIPWPPFSLWCLALAVAVFRDKREGEVREFPRWVGYLSLLTAFLFVPPAGPCSSRRAGTHTTVCWACTCRWPSSSSGSRR